MTLSCIAATLIATRYYVTCIYFKNTGYVFLEDVNHGASYSCRASTMKKLTMSKHPESPSPRGRNAYTSTFHLAMVCILIVFLYKHVGTNSLLKLPHWHAVIKSSIMHKLKLPGKLNQLTFHTQTLMSTLEYTWLMDVYIRTYIIYYS